MHELSIANSLLEIACDEAARHGAGRIVRISCRIGCLRQVDRRCLEDAFAMARQGTAAESAELTATHCGMMLECRDCGHHAQLDGWQFDCPECHSSEVALSGGDELELTTIELEVPDEYTGSQEEPDGAQRSGCRTHPVAS